MAAKSKSKTIWETFGPVSLPIYPMADGRWCIVYRAAKGGKRQRILRKSLEDAKAKAWEFCEDIAAGRKLAATITEEDRLQLLAAREYVEPLGLSVDVAARELAEASRIAGDAAVLVMARFWARHHQAAASKRTAHRLSCAATTVRSSSPRKCNAGWPPTTSRPSTSSRAARGKTASWRPSTAACGTSA